MPSTHRNYDKDFRQEAVNLLLSSELPSSVSLRSSPIRPGRSAARSAKSNICVASARSYL
jgi:hypothetical protein